jgi:hypothetical protein
MRLSVFACFLWRGLNISGRDYSRFKPDLMPIKPARKWTIVADSGLSRIRRGSGMGG